MKRYLVQKKGLLTATFLLGAVTASSSALLAILLQKLIDTVLQGDGNKFFLLAIVAAGYLCFLGIINYCYAYCGKKLLRKVLASIREAVFLGITRRPPSSRGENKVGDDLSAFTNDAALIEQNHLIPLLTVAEYSFMFLVYPGAPIMAQPCDHSVSSYFDDCHVSGTDNLGKSTESAAKCLFRAVGSFYCHS